MGGIRQEVGRARPRGGRRSGDGRASGVETPGAARCRGDRPALAQPRRASVSCPRRPPRARKTASPEYDGVQRKIPLRKSASVTRRSPSLKGSWNTWRTHMPHRAQARSDDPRRSGTGEVAMHPASPDPSVGEHRTRSPLSRPREAGAAGRGAGLVLHSARRPPVTPRARRLRRARSISTRACARATSGRDQQWSSARRAMRGSTR